MNVSAVIDRVSLDRDPERIQGMLAEVNSHVQHLNKFYPQFEQWMALRVMPGITAGERSILVEYRAGLLAGIAIVKDDGIEKKLCCLRVLPEFRDTRGLGVRLFDKAFDVLEEHAPLLSVTEERLSSFERIFRYFGFEIGEKYQDLYRIGKAEYSFNGSLNTDKAPITSSTKCLPNLRDFRTSTLSCDKSQ
jgi:ribosomal protein S18 acetylase RimI-like enzyme